MMHSVKVNGYKLSNWGLVIADGLPRIQSPKTEYRLVQLKNRLIGKYEKQVERTSGAVSFTLNGIYKNIQDMHDFNSHVYSKLTTEPLHILEFDDEPGVEYLVRLDTASKELMSGGYDMADGQKLIIQYNLKFTIDLERSKLNAITTTDEDFRYDLKNPTGWLVVAVEEFIEADGEVGYPQSYFSVSNYTKANERYTAYTQDPYGPHIRRPEHTNKQSIQTIRQHYYYTPHVLDSDVVITYDPFISAITADNQGQVKAIGHMQITGYQGYGDIPVVDVSDSKSVFVSFSGGKPGLLRRLTFWEVK